MKKSLVIFGSTGHIGRNTLRCINEFPESFQLVALTGWHNTEKLKKQAAKWHPQYIGVKDSQQALEIHSALPNVQCVWGKEGLYKIAQLSVDCVVGGIAGGLGLHVFSRVLNHAHVLSLANKETIVEGGYLFMQAVLGSSTTLIPIDSEHSALFQLSKPYFTPAIRKFYLLASGGPFYTYTQAQTRNVKPVDVFSHPVWRMGFKISTDSATLVNKALELAEACYLFGIPEDKIVVQIHPRGLIHGAIEHLDGSIQLLASRPDMRLPIMTGLFYPEPVPKLHDTPMPLSALNEAEFFDVPTHLYRPIRLMRQCLRESNQAVILFNLANNIAVQAFKEEKILFADIIPLIEKILNMENTSRTITTITEVNEYSTQMEEKLKRVYIDGIY